MEKVQVGTLVPVSCAPMLTPRWGEAEAAPGPPVLRPQPVAALKPLGATKKHPNCLLSSQPPCPIWMLLPIFPSGHWEPLNLRKPTIPWSISFLGWNSILFTSKSVTNTASGGRAVTVTTMAGHCWDRRTVINAGVQLDYLDPNCLPAVWPRTSY